MVARELIFDVETTGYPNSKPLGDASQPWVVELGMIMRHDGVVMSEVGLLVRLPSDDFEMAEGALKAHGIPTAMSRRFGIGPKSAAALFLHHVMCVDRIVAFNIDFDWKMMQIMAARAELQLPDTTERVCIMKAATPHCRLPSKNPRYSNYKDPKLVEAVECLTKEEDRQSLKGRVAHRAMADTIAAMLVWDRVQELETIEL